jgi:hypothetical protein
MLDFSFLGLTRTAPAHVMSCEPALKEALPLHIEAIRVKALKEAFDLHNDVTMGVVDCVHPTKVEYLFQDFEVGLYPGVLGLENQGVCASLHDPTDKSDHKLPLFAFPSFNEKLLKINFFLVKWPVASEGHLADEGGQVDKVLLDEACVGGGLLGCLVERVFVDEEAPLEQLYSLLNSERDGIFVTSLLDHVDKDGV